LNATSAREIPRISVITPSLNQAPYLEQTLRSVLGQDYPDLEYIVIDGGSEDGSLELIESFGDKLSYWISEPDRGQSHAINKGFAKATGDIYCWINADDYLLPGALNRMAEAWSAEQHRDWWIGGVDELRMKTSMSSPYPVDKSFSFEELPWRHKICQPGVFWRSRIHLPLDLGLHYAMDLDLWNRFWRTSGKAGFVNQQLAVNRIYDTTKTNTGGSLILDELYTISKRYGSSLSLSILMRYGIVPAVCRANTPAKPKFWRSIRFAMLKVACMVYGRKVHRAVIFWSYFINEN